MIIKAIKKIIFDEIYNILNNDTSSFYYHNDENNQFINNVI